MATFNLVGGAFNAVYIGVAAASGTPLTQVNPIGTGEYRFSYTEPRSNWLAATNGTVQNGLCRIDLSFTFISDDPQGITLAMSNFITSTQSTTPSGTQFSILLLDAINTNGSSIFIPTCEAIVNWTIVRSKKAQAEIPIKFFWQQRNAATNLYYKDTNANLKTIMGLVSPY